MFLSLPKVVFFLFIFKKKTVQYFRGHSRSATTHQHLELQSDFYLDAPFIYNSSCSCKNKIKFNYYNFELN